MQREPTFHERQRWQRSWRWSAMLHLGIGTAMLVEALWLPLPFFAAQSAVAKQMIIVQQSAVDHEPLEVEMQVEERFSVVRDAENLTYSQIDLSDPRWDDILAEPKRRAFGHDDDPADASANMLVSEQLRRSIEASSRNSDEQNFNSLTQLAGRLEQVSTEKTVDELSGTLNRLTGASARAPRPIEDAVGEFDFNTAQPHDCKKETTADGEARYLVVMIDAEGRTQETEVDPAVGEQIYKTMELLKANPLLERVYRGVVMGILDNLLRPPMAK